MPKRKEKPHAHASAPAPTTRLFARRVEIGSGSSNLHVLVAESQERERLRIGAELHDSVLQSLVRIKLDIEQLVAEVERRPARDVASSLTELGNDVRGCIREIRAILADLVPPHLENVDIIEALHRCIDGFRDRSGLHVRRRLDPVPADFGMQHKLVLFRILQEALNNVQKHAGASRVGIELRTSQRAVRLRVIDNGCGFAQPSEDSANHWGLKNMRHRAATLGGSTIIRSAPGHGTIVIAKIPLLAGDTAA